ncbi:hypothetical protein SeLEV6574_g08479, partial [Synchytrium endobioticum]
PVFGTPEKDRYGNIVETIELTPTVTTVITPNGSRLVRAPLYASPTDKIAPQPHVVEPSYAAFKSTQKTKEADTRQPRLPFPDLSADLSHRIPQPPDMINNNMMSSRSDKWPRDHVTPKPVIVLPGTRGSTTMNTRKAAPPQSKHHTNDICFPPVAYGAVSRVIVLLQNLATKSAIWEVSGIGKPHCENVPSASAASSSAAPRAAKRKLAMGQDCFVFAHTRGKYSQTFHLRCNGQVVVIHVERRATVPIYKQQKSAVSGGPAKPGKGSAFGVQFQATHCWGSGRRSDYKRGNEISGDDDDAWLYPEDL